MEFNAVILDMDGLMLDTEPIYKTAWQSAASALGYLISDRLFFSLLGKNNKESERLVVQGLGPDFPLREFRNLWQEHWRVRVEKEGIDTKEGLQELLDFLKGKSIPLAVATSTDFIYARLCLDSTKLLNRFDYLVTGDQVDRSKPAPDIYLEAAKKIGIKPSRCIALEDSNSGALSAISAGMKTIVVPDLIHPSDEVLAKTYKVVSSLREALTLMRDFFPEQD